MRATTRIRMMTSWASQSLTFHKTRSLLTITAVGLATALVASTLSFQSGYERSLKRNIDATGYQILGFTSTCRESKAIATQSIPGSSQPRAS